MYKLIDVIRILIMDNSTSNCNLVALFYPVM